MTPKKPLKPHKSYTELANLLESRGMVVGDKSRVERKLAQVGYYRLSGYWYTCREIKKDANNDYLINPKTNTPEREDTFQANTHFNDVFELYLFDKRLRLLILDAIERVEIYIRSVIAHEMGGLDPLAHKKDKFINPDKMKGPTNYWADWLSSQASKINRSRETCIKWYKQNYIDIPFWVAIEAWDFGTLSQYYSLLKTSHQNHIAKKLNINNAKTLVVWLRELNTLRNSCAHHTRVWNQSAPHPIGVLNNFYFNSLNLDTDAKKRLYGMICILWFLVKEIGPNSEWIKNIADLIDSKPKIPACPYTAMGFGDNQGFPRHKFNI